MPSVEFWRYSSRNRSGGMQPITMARRNLILELWAAGSTKDDIALQVGIDLDTVSSHLQAARRANDARAVIRHPATVSAMATVRLSPSQAGEIIDRIMTDQVRKYGVVYADGTRDRAVNAGVTQVGVDAVTEAIDWQLRAGEVTAK